MLTEAQAVELIPAYALGSLDEDEAEQVAAHLQSCTTCQAELRLYQNVVDGLALAVPPATPPPALADRLLRQIQVKSPEPVPKQPRWQSIWQKILKPTPIWQLATLGLMGLLIISNIFLLVTRSPKAAPTRPDIMKTIPLFPTDSATEAHGTIVIGLDGDKGALVVEDLPPLPANQQYQFWLADDNIRVSGGTLTIDADGYGTIIVAAPQPLDQYSGFGVSIEAVGGNNAPTGNRVLRWGSEWDQ